MGSFMKTNLRGTSRLAGTVVRAIIVGGIVWAAGCGRLTERGPVPDGEERYRTEFAGLKRDWKEYGESGDYLALIDRTRPFVRKAAMRRDTLAAVNCMLALSQAFLFAENRDSTKYYLDMIDRFRPNGLDPVLSAAIDNINGIYAMKFDSDYSSAIGYFYNGYEKLGATDRVDNRIVFLGNIVHIFYIRSDGNGLEWARRAYELSRQEGVRDFSKCQAHVAMAQMLFLEGETDEADFHVRRAGELARRNGFVSAYAIIDLLDAGIACRRDEIQAADSLYRRALDFSEDTEPATVGLCFLHYGEFCEKTGNREKALSLYRRGADNSYLYNNVELRHSFLYRLAVLSHRMGRENTALDAALKYVMLNDELAYGEKVRNFNSRILRYRRMTYENELQARELESLKADRKIYTAVFFTVVVSLSACFLLLLYVRQRRMYRILASRYNSYVQRLNDARASVDDGAGSNVAAVDDSVPEPAAPEGAEDDTADKALFERIESLMKNDRFYSRKEISLNAVADRLGSNRTYVSRAINRFAGMNFYNYINMHRIIEAAGRMSSESFDVPLKTLADELGFVSVSAFYKAFRRETGCTASQYRKEMMHSAKKNMKSCSDT